MASEQDRKMARKWQKRIATCSNCRDLAKNYGFPECEQHENALAKFIAAARVEGMELAADWIDWKFTVFYSAPGVVDEDRTIGEASDAIRKLLDRGKDS
jgi:hypothetical protein